MSHFPESCLEHRKSRGGMGGRGSRERGERCGTNIILPQLGLDERTVNGGVSNVEGNCWCIQSWPWTSALPTYHHLELWGIFKHRWLNIAYFTSMKGEYHWGAVAPCPAASKRLTVGTAAPRDSSMFSQLPWTTEQLSLLKDKRFPLDYIHLAWNLLHTINSELVQSDNNVREIQE